MQAETQQLRCEGQGYAKKTIHIIHSQLRPRKRGSFVAPDATPAELATAREDARAGRDALAGKATARAEDATRDEEWREKLARVTQED